MQLTDEEYSRGHPTIKKKTCSTTSTVRRHQGGTSEKFKYMNEAKLGIVWIFDHSSFGAAMPDNVLNLDGVENYRDPKG